MTIPRKLSFLFVALSVSSAVGYDPALGDFSRANPAHIRIVAWNTEKFLMSTDPAKDGAYQRLFAVLDPDIIAMSEVVPSFSAAQIRDRLNALRPLPGGANWQVLRGQSDGFNRNVLASRYPLSMTITDTTPASEVRGVTGALVDLPNAAYGTDVYVMGLHLKCCTEEGATQRRQKHGDALAKWFGDLRTPGGAVDLPLNTPVFAVGDFNFVDPNPQQPEVTLRTGNIIDEAAYGPDIQGDWDASDLTDLVPRDPYTTDPDTWSANTNNPGSRLDRIYFTDSVVSVANSFVLNTRTMTIAQRTAAGLQQYDCETAADHLPIAVDLALPLVPVELSGFTIE